MVCALLGSTSFVASPALADSLSATRSEQLQEVSHRIDISVDRGFATLVVRRTVFNGGERHDQALFGLDLPDGAAAIGLRTLGMLEGRPHWFSGDLLEAETAAARYKELTGIGGYYPKDPALLSWRWQGHLALQVFPCAPGTNKTVEYTLVMPTEYREGRHHLRLPRLGTESLAATLSLRAARAGDRLLVDDREVQPGTELAFSSSDELDIAVEARVQPSVSGALAVMPVAADRVVTHARIDVARRLSTIPAHARVVVLLDASRSLSDGERTASIAGARAYLSHFPDGIAEVISFDRAPHPMHGRLVPTAKAIEDLASLVLSPANGSAVDAALERAALILGATAGGERRVVLFTDTRTRSALTDDGLRARFRAAGGIVHVALPELGAASLDRDDEQDWSGIARSTGGLVWTAYAGQDQGDDTAANEVYTELARPVRLDHVKISSGGFLSEEVTSVERLDEGQGLTDLQIGKPAGSSFSVEGELWTRRVRSTTNAAEDEARRWSALIFGSDKMGELSEPEMMVLAKRGGAVSPVTSYLAIEPGVRPSTEGLEEGVGEGFGAGGIGLGGVGTGSGRAGGIMDTFDRLAWLKAAMAPAWAACGGAPGTVRVDIETTVAEIVDVPAITGGAPPSATACLREAVWGIELPREFWFERRTWAVRL